MAKTKAVADAKDKAGPAPTEKRPALEQVKAGGPQRLQRALMPAAGGAAAMAPAGGPPPPGAPGRARTMGALQRTIGNARLARMAEPPPTASAVGGANGKHRPIQTKLAVGPADDPFEREADVAASRIAAGQPVQRISRLSGSGIASAHRKCATCGTEMEQKPAAGGPVQRKCTACEQEEKAQRQPRDWTPEDEKKRAAPLQTKAAGTAGSEPGLDTERAEQAMSRAGPGSPLAPAMRARMEGGFGADFAGVRVHTGAAADEASRAVNARAFTRGSDIYLARGESASDPRLMAHELTHTVQQEGSRPLGRVQPQKSMEPSAGESGARIAQYSAAPTAPSPIGKEGPVTGAVAARRIMRKGFESTIEICHRVLESKHFEVTKGGLRVVFVLEALDKDIPNCEDFNFGVTLTRSRDWWPDDEIGTCEASTGGTRSFSFANLPRGTYYLTIWRSFDHPYCCLKGDILVFDEESSTDSAGCTRDKDPSALDIVHGALDIAGFIPVLGALPDGINAAIYVVEGDWVNAGLSAVAMVPVWGDGVKLAEIAGKSAISLTRKAAIRLGEEGIAKGLKEVKAASKIEKAALETTEEAAKIAKAEKEAAQEAAKAEKEAAEESTKAEKRGETEEKKKKGGGKWTCYGWSAVLQIPSALPEFKCPLDGQYVQGPSVSASSEAAACLAAKHAFNAMMPRGCRPKHLDCRCTKR